MSSCKFISFFLILWFMGSSEIWGMDDPQKENKPLLRNLIQNTKKRKKNDEEPDNFPPKRLKISPENLHSNSRDCNNKIEHINNKFIKHSFLSLKKETSNEEKTNILGASIIKRILEKRRLEKSNNPPGIPQNYQDMPNPLPTPPVKDDDSEDDDNYHYQTPRSRKKLGLSPLFQNDLKSINLQLAENKNPNFSEHTPFLIPFYRGVNYLKELFPTANDRKTHRQNAKAGTPLFCSAAYALLGKTFLNQEDADIILLEKNAQLIESILRKFKTTYPKEYYKFHELYSNNHKTFHENLTNVIDLKEVQLQNYLYPFYIYKVLFTEAIGLDTQEQYDAFQRNPFVSCSMTIKHALKYSFGLKSFDGTPIEPNYTPIKSNSPYCEPTHPYLGILYVILINPQDLLNLNPTSIVGAQQQRCLEVKSTVHNNILSEYEVSFFGWIPPQYVFSTVPVRVPNFKKGMKPYHELKYGPNLHYNSTLTRKDIFEKTSEDLTSIIERKIQDELTVKYPNSPTYQAYWRPDGKFGPSLISTTTVLALREPNISLNPRQGKKNISFADLEYLSEMFLTSPHTEVEVKDYTKLQLLTPRVISSLSQSLQRGIITHLTLSRLVIDNSLKTKPMVWSELLHNNNLQYLDLNFNKMGDEALLHIADNLSRNSQLKTLKVADNAGSHIPAIKLALALADNNVLTELDYSHNKLFSDQQRLSLNQSALSGPQDGIPNLCDGLFQNTTLKKLNLSGNSINNMHCTHHLIKLTNLAELNLSNNNITDTNTAMQLKAQLTKTTVMLQ